MKRIKVTKISKELLGIAGEFRVASELCRREIYAQLTLGNRKQTDLLLDNEKGMLRVSVKSKQDPSWPAVKGVTGERAVLVLVDFKDKSINDSPDFYILDAKDWKDLLRTMYIVTGKVARGEVTIDSNCVPTWPSKTKKKPFVGGSIRPKDVLKHKDKWDTIQKLISGLL